MPKKVITRPQTKDRTSINPISIAEKCRVAAYARVSTDEEEQQNSYSAQINYYTNLIQGNPDWEFAGMYSDEGISGTSIRHREGFQHMIADALDGKIDRIITKSISRFARNTVDMLSFVRQLKDKGVDVFFEKENIHTLDIKGELMITIMSSLAQEESRSISENVKWGMRKRFADGKVSMNYSRFLGYRKGPDGNPEIVPEEAAIVERIYDLFLEGKTPSGIARLLTQEAVPTPGNGLKWRAKTVESILTNEKYKGDAILQKTFVADFLTKRKQINQGEYPQYYVMGSHPAIIDPEKFDAVQLEMQQRKASPNHRFTPHCFSGYIYCAKCGSIFGSKTWNSNSKYRRIVWECNSKYSGEKRCNAPIAHEDQVQEAFIKAINKVIGSKAEVIDLCEKALDRRGDIEALEKKIHSLQTDISVTAELMKRQADSAEETDYSERYEQLTAELVSAKAELAEINSRRPKLMAYLQVLRNQPLVQEFDELLWRGTVDRVWVKETGALRFVFKDGQEVEIRYLRHLKPQIDVPILSLGEDVWNMHTARSDVFITKRPAIDVGESAALLLRQNIASPVLFETKSVELADNFNIELLQVPCKTQNIHIETAESPALRILMESAHGTASAIGSLMRDFEATHLCRIIIDTRPMEDMFDAIVSNSKAESNLYDVFMYDIPWLPSFADEGFLADITDYIRNEWRPENYLSPRLPELYGKFNDKYYGIPFTYSPPILFYRIDLFSDFKLRKEYYNRYQMRMRPPKTWTEYNALAEFFNEVGRQDSRFEYGICLYGQSKEHLIPNFLPRLAAFGGGIFNDRLQITINSPACRKALLSLKKTAELSSMPFNNSTLVTATKEFYEGKTALLFGHGSYATAFSKDISSPVAGKVGYAPLPGNSPHIAGWGLGISASSRQRTLALRFFDWLGRSDISTYSAILEGQSLLFGSHSNSELQKVYPWLSLEFDSLADITLRSGAFLNGGQVVPRNRIEECIYSNICAYLTNRYSLEETVASMERELKKLFRDYGYSGF